MMKPFCLRLQNLRPLETGPIAPHLGSFAALLAQQRYCRVTGWNKLRLAKSADMRLDKEIVAQYGQFLLATNGAGANALKQIEQTSTWKLGALPLEKNLPANAEAWQAASSDIVFQTKSKLFFTLRFYHTDAGLPALLSYLQHKGCTDFHYELSLPSNDDEPDAEMEK